MLRKVGKASPGQQLNVSLMSARLHWTRRAAGSRWEGSLEDGAVFECTVRLLVLSESWGKLMVNI